MDISFYVIPVVIFLIILYAVVKKGNIIFDSFLLGAKNGIEITYSITPSLVGLITSVSMLKASGALELLSLYISPVTNYLNFPAKLVPLAILKPVSGSASIAILNNILQECGPDSTIGRIAALIAGSTETTLYTIAIYFGSVGIKKTRHTATVALLADFVALILSVIFTNLYWLY